jgi:ferritin-like metal-binding protein YciE
VKLKRPFGRRRDKEVGMNLNSLNDVFVEQIHDLHSAEEQLVVALPKMAGAASSDKLREAFEHHLDETRAQLERLDEIIATLGLGPATEPCKAMQGLVAEGDEIVAAHGDPDAKDAALVAAAQRVEHYEIAGYGTARTLAGQLGHDDARELLDETLHEESSADKLLTKIATGGLLGTGINEQAAR